MTVGELATHNHVYFPDTKKNGTSGGTAWLFDAGTKGTATNVARSTENTGNNAYHNNLQPSSAVYRFKRVS